LASLTGPRILIADDDPVLRELLSLLLTTEGYSPEGAATPEAVLSAIKAEPWALILLDTLGATPGDPAFTAMSNLCQAAGDTPVMLMTGSTTVAKWGESNSAFADVLVKPFELDSFFYRVKRLTANAAVEP
jgi:DNA-binding response OmpR family regulator